MAWSDTQAVGTDIDHTEWNAMVSYIQSVIESSGTANPTTLKIGGTQVSASAAELNVLDGISPTVTELNYVDGVTSAIQTQLNARVSHSMFTAKGDLAAASAASTPVRLGTGSNGQILTVSSGAATGLAWTSPAGGGDMAAATYDPATIAEQLIGLTASQTATNKTLTSPNFIAVVTAGEAVTAGSICYLTAGEFMNADADAEATAKGMLGIPLSNIGHNTAGNFLIEGFYNTSGLTAGTEYYIHTTPGPATGVKPSGTGDIVRIVGYGLSTTVLYFRPSATYVEVV